MSIEVGLKGRSETVVTQHNTANAIGSGLVQAGGKRVAAPVGGGSGYAYLLHQLPELCPVYWGPDRRAVLLTYDIVPSPAQPGRQIRLDFRVDRDDPVPAGGRLYTALEIISVRVVRKSGKGEQLGDPEAGVTEDQHRPSPKVPCIRQLLQLFELEICKSTLLVLGSYRGQADKLGIVLKDNITLHGTAK